MLNQNTIGENFSRAAQAMKPYFRKLLGITLLYYLMTSGISLVAGITLVFAPFVMVIAVLPLAAGLTYTFLKAIRGQQVGVSDLVAGFSGSGNFGRVLGGMLWMMLWIIIWALAPVPVIVLLAFAVEFTILPEVVGVMALFAVMIAWVVLLSYKILQYFFTPYILIDHPEIPATEALKVSMRYTDGLKGRLLGTMMIICAIEAAAMFGVGLILVVLLSLSAAVENVGVVLLLVLLIYLLLIAAVIAFNVYTGLIYASFYNNADAAFCPNRGFDQYNPWNTMEYRNMYQQNPPYQPFNQQGYPQYPAPPYQQPYQQPAPPQNNQQNGGSSKNPWG